MPEAKTSPVARKAMCVVCRKEKGIQKSLRLTKDAKGRWVTNPVCADCHRNLVADARATGLFVPFFALDASEQEAAKRNDRTALNRPFLEKFGRKLEEKPKQTQSAKVVPLKHAG
jgi:hypothetical protein